MSPKVLIVEDDAGLREALVDTLSLSNYSVFEADCAEQALLLLKKQAVDLVLTDVQMGTVSGLALLRSIKSQWPTLPVVLMTAFGNIHDAVEAMKEGACDYLAKPFNPRELLARIRAILRRGTGQPETRRVNKAYRFRGYTFDGSLHQLTDPKGEVTELTGSEAKLMQLLLEAENRVLSRDFLLEQISGRQSDAFDRSIDNQISRLRKKIEKNPAKPEFIKTVRGGGYRFTIATTQDGDTG